MFIVRAEGLLLAQIRHQTLEKQGFGLEYCSPFLVFPTAMRIENRPEEEAKPESGKWKVESGKVEKICEFGSAAVQ